MMNRLILLMMLFPAFASSDPGPATRYLMNEPATLMDIGLMKARLHILPEASYHKEVLDVHYSDATVYDVSLFVYYVFEDDEIVFSAAIDAEADLPADACERNIFSLDLSVRDSYAEWFSHDGFQRQSLPGEFNDQLASRIVLKCSIARGIYGMLNPRVEAFRRLNEDEIFYSEKKTDE